jgi:predicted hydrocarbon binding protein
MKKLARVRNHIAVKWTGRLKTKSKKREMAGDPRSRAVTKPDKTPANISKTTSGFRQSAVGSTITMLVAARNRLTKDATRKLISNSKNQTLFGFAKFMAWLRIPLAARPEYVRFKEWLRTPLTPRSLLPVAAVWALAVIPIRFGIPWTYVSDTSGYAAILMTALTTARLTVSAPRATTGSFRRPEPRHEGFRDTDGPVRRGKVLREIEEFFEQDLEMGPRETNIKNHAFLMRKRDWQMLQDAIYDTFLKGAPPLLYEMGLRLGASIAGDLEKLSPKPGAMLSHLEEVSRAAGWGIVSVHGDLALGTKLTFRIQESPFCACNSPLEKNTYSCHLVSGLVAGIVERIYGWAYTALERKCVRDGHDCCEIVVTQSMAPERPARRWNLSVLFPVLKPWG